MACVSTCCVFQCWSFIIAGKKNNKKKIQPLTEMQLHWAATFRTLSEKGSKAPGDSRDDKTVGDEPGFTQSTWQNTLPDNSLVSRMRILAPSSLHLNFNSNLKQHFYQVKSAMHRRISKTFIKIHPIYKQLRNKFKDHKGQLVKSCCAENKAQ